MRYDCDVFDFQVNRQVMWQRLSVFYIVHIAKSQVTCFNHMKHLDDQYFLELSCRTNIMNVGSELNDMTKFLTQMSV